MSVAQMSAPTAPDRCEKPDQIAAVGGARSDELKTPEKETKGGFEYKFADRRLDKAEAQSLAYSLQYQQRNKGLVPIRLNQWFILNESVIKELPSRLPMKIVF